ncbi:glycosyltransferase [Cellulomonas sp. URHD0024]|uniref:glycosyltransferase n=1 Tax=Cellulomonas sp. URHD0024 TaxID=1302620 RepID=UPI0003FEBAEA|nr:glycosyltransferase [Cellulomonas sp. URHD0024]
MTDTLQPVDVPTATSSTPVTPPVSVPVSAVLVTHGRTPYLETTLAALAQQTRRPMRVFLVDVSHVPDEAVEPAFRRIFAAADDASRGPSPALHLVHTPGARTFGHAVRRALASEVGPTTSWLWLLHDDSAPADTALAELVRAVGRAPSVAVAGVKQRTWTDPERLLEVGLRTSRSGRRMTDVEPGELDQGQHDGRDDVLGVGLAGALVRRDVWDALRGTDPLLGPFGDGFDLSRRARLAGHRVVVVPSAVVRHAQAGYLGLRTAESRVPTDLDGDGEDDAADPRHSFDARRRALVHSRLVGAPMPLVPFVALMAIVGAVVRSLWQLAVKQPGLAVAELRSVLVAVCRPAGVVRARARATRTRRLPRRALRPLQAGVRDVWSQSRDRRLARAEVRRVVQAPSELELRELSALATKRRVTLVVLVGGLAIISAVALGTLLAPVVGGARLVGDALLPTTARLGDLWSAATSGWVAGGLGAPGPADALLTVLVGPTAAAGGSSSAVVAVLLLGSLVLAGIAAWAAAGAVTRSVGVRAWAAVVWAAAPALLLGLGAGRLGAVVAHVGLPWVGLGLARAIGVQRVDQVLSGVATAKRVDDDDVDPEGPVTSSLPHPRLATDSGQTPAVAPADVTARVGAADPTGSIAAAAGAALAFALVVAGAPVLLVPGVLALCVVALSAPRRRGRVLLAAVPAVVLLAPTLLEAARRGLPGWCLLVADPGLPVPSQPTDPVSRLLGVPSDPGSLVGTGLASGLTHALPLAVGAVVLVLAVLALLRGAPVARAVRGAWVVAGIGLATATVVGLVPVAVDGGSVVRGWSGPGLSLAGAGLLVAALIGTDRLRERLGRYTFGVRQLLAALLSLVAVVVPLVWLGTWTWQARTGDAVALRTLDGPIVPAVGQQAQETPASSRVLAVSAGPEQGSDPTATWQLMRGDGPALVDQAAAAWTRTLEGDLTETSATPADAATQEVDALVARLATAASGDVAGELGSLGVADVLVPALPGPVAADPLAKAARDELVSRLDATAGLQRVTANAAGTLWRVQATAPGAGIAAPSVVTSWARVLPDGAAVADPSAQAVEVPSAGRAVDTSVPAGDAGRRLVLAERADPHWHAYLDGESLRALHDGWRQSFELGAGAGDLVVRYDSPDRTPVLALQSLVLLVTVLLAVPVRRRRGGRTWSGRS